MLIYGYTELPKFADFPVTAVATTTGKTLWRVPVTSGIGGDLWMTPTDVVFSDSRRVYDASPATGLRWSVPGRTDDALLTSTDPIYYQWKETSPLKPVVNTVYDRRLSDARVRWTLSRSPYVILAPSGPNLLLTDSDPLSTSPGTVVYPVSKQTGRQVTAKVMLPAGVLATPAVVGGDTIYQLNPWECESA
jgi:hypothetical protein